MRRREFITLIGGAAFAPIAARAQQAMPVVGYIGLGSQASGAHMMSVARQALAHAGYVEGRTVANAPRWAEGTDSRLPELAAEMVRRQVAVMQH